VGTINIPELIGVTDGKAVGTFVENRLKIYLRERFDVPVGSSALGIDLPSIEINTDIKVTSIRQPQSSCPYKSPRQKIFGLGYNLLVLVYDKKDAVDSCYLNFQSCTFIKDSRTADYTVTKRLSEMLKDGANKEDIIGFTATIQRSARRGHACPYLTGRRFVCSIILLIHKWLGRQNRWAI